MLRFFVFLLWVSPCVLTKATGRCQGEVCDVKTWHNVSCRTDDDCNQTHAVCDQHLCRCEAGYFYTTPYDICSVTCSTGELQDSFTEYPDSALRRHYLDRRDGLSLEDCKGRCLTDTRCLTFDFRVIEGQCRLHNVTSYESPSHWYPKTSTGWTHYQRTCNSTLATHLTWYNSLCNTIVDCPDTNSDCLSGRCLCRSDFKFIETEKECAVTSEWHNVSCRTDDDCNQTHAVCYQHLCRCEAGYFYTTPYDICSGTCSTGELQDSFTEYPDSALRRHYLDRRDGLSLEDCKSRCQDDKRCLTFDFRVIEGQCRLHAVTSRGSPSHWYPKTSEGWTHYQRTCNSTLATHHTWYNSLCNTIVDCPDPNSDCLSHRCLCRSGFKFIETEKECVVASVWHNVSCRTDDDCNQPHAVCYQHLCRCEAGYFYTTPYDICSVTCSTGELQDSFTEYPDSALRRHYLDRRDGLSLEDCKGRCLTDTRCLTFDFRVIEGQCRLHNVTSYESPSHWYPKTSTGWTHYQRTCKSTLGSPDDWYNSLCNTIVDCRDPNSDCLSHRCLCRSGFKFNETEKKCVVTSVWHNVSCTTDDDCNQTHAVCYQHLCRCEAGFFYTTPYDICSGTCSTGELQDSFTEYPDSALRRHYLERWDGLSLEDCKGRCQTNKRCLTFDFRVIEGQCRLHNVTSYESPSDWYPKTSKGWTHYQRTCKSTLGSPDDWYNSLCNTKEDCRDPNSDCLSHRCLCRSGFKFIETEKECVVARSCLDWQDKGAKSGVYTIQLLGSSKPRSVWCDMDTAGGGWTVIHRRRDFSVDFNRNWREYVNGFGNISGDYWLGLSAIHEQIRYKSWSLRVDIVDGSGERRYAQYGWFRLDGPEDNYKLSWYWYWGDAGDDLTPSYDKEFSTYDRDPTGCVRARHSAWWYPDDCGRTYLNSPSASGNVWGDYSNLQFSEMKLRPYESTLGLTPAP